MNRAPYLVLVLLTGIWLAVVLVTPIAADRGHAAAPLLYAAFDTICHQISERSFHLAGHPLAVCHRCSGLYLGFFLGLLTVPHFPRARRWLLDVPRRTLYFAVPMLIDWALIANHPASRFLTGLLAAAPIAVLAWGAGRQLFSAGADLSLEGET